jgi:hypothetical protein
VLFRSALDIFHFNLIEEFRDSIPLLSRNFYVLAHDSAEELEAFVILARHLKSKLAMEGDRRSIGLVDMAF